MLKAMKYKAYDGKIFDTKEECKKYEQAHDDFCGIRMSIMYAHLALQTLDSFCTRWLEEGYMCKNCPLTNLCNLDKETYTTFEELFNKDNPFGNIGGEDNVLSEEEE